jgi:hypothetical protein
VSRVRPLQALPPPADLTEHEERVACELRKPWAFSY